MKRRKFIKGLSLSTSFAISPFISLESKSNEKSMFFEIGLAEWSLNKALNKGDITNMDFPSIAKNDYGINIIEYVNQFFMDKATNKIYLNELLSRTKDLGITNHLIMVDDEGDLGNTDRLKRNIAVDNHKKWVEAAKFLGCDSIRVNAQGTGSRESVSKAAIDGLGSLADFALDYGINVIVENHGGYSSDGKWLMNIIRSTSRSNVGTLPDFGNFCISGAWGSTQDECSNKYDKYLGVKEMMPYAKSVSAKSYDFDDEGNCIETDFYKMLEIVKKSGYNKYISIEYEGTRLSEYEGIRKTKALLEKVGKSI